MRFQPEPRDLDDDDSIGYYFDSRGRTVNIYIDENLDDNNSDDGNYGDDNLRPYFLNSQDQRVYITKDEQRRYSFDDGGSTTDLEIHPKERGSEVVRNAPSVRSS